MSDLHDENEVHEEMGEEQQLAQEALYHQIAACLHLALVSRRKTVAEFKAAYHAVHSGPLRSQSDALIDRVLAGTAGDLSLTEMADISYTLGFDWSIKMNTRV